MKITPPTIAEIKDATLKMEVEHAQRVGLPRAVAEAENVRMLERSERIERDTKPELPKQRAPREQRVKDRGVTAKPVSTIKEIKPSPCGRCGSCRNCKRERRVLLIIQKRKDDPSLGALALKLLQVAMRVGRFRFLSGRDYERAVTACAEDACNASIPKLGEWLR